MRDKIRLKHYSYQTEKTYLGWVKRYIERYILFHEKQHRENIGKSEIEAFLTDLAVNPNVSPIRQN